MWCPINPRNEAAENRELLDLFDCEVVIFQAPFAPLVEAIRGDLPGVHSWIRLDDDVAAADDPTILGWSDFLESGQPGTTPTWLPRLRPTPWPCSSAPAARRAARRA